MRKWFSQTKREISLVLRLLIYQMGEERPFKAAKRALAAEEHSLRAAWVTREMGRKACNQSLVHSAISAAASVLIAARSHL